MTSAGPASGAAAEPAPARRGTDGTTSRPAFSVIVPTLNEAGHVAETLRSARAALGNDAELLVVDGGSHDGTVERARSLAAVLHVDGGRGPQLEAGAGRARGEILVFLHADTRLPPGSGDAMRRAVEAGAGAGCHRFGVNPPPGGPGRWRALEAAVNVRTRLFRTATGDQALFATRETYRRAGGFPPHPLFEDVGFVRRVRRVAPFRVLPLTARTSRRRWESRGFLRTVLLHLGLRAAHRLGVPPRKLAALYSRERG